VQVYRNAIFAGGGCRCFWQLGFWEGAKAQGLHLGDQVRFIGAVSAGAAMAAAAMKRPCNRCSLSMGNETFPGTLCVDASEVA
jgi:hypothetical protein